MRRRQPRADSEHYRVKALEQALGILDVLAESPDLALPEIADRIGLATPNAHKLILHLQEAGFVETGMITKRYRLGARRLAQLTERALDTNSPWEAFRQSVPRLEQATGIDGLIAVLQGSRVVYVEQFRGPDDASGRAFPAHATALGKALLAESPAAVLDEVVLDAWSARTITDRAGLEADLAATRERGWALEDGELDVRWRSIGAVVRDHSGTAVAAIGIGHFAERLPDDTLPELAASVREEAQRISDALGGVLGALAPPRLVVSLLGAVEPPVPPVPRTTPVTQRRRARTSGE